MSDPSLFEGSGPEEAPISDGGVEESTFSVTELNSAIRDTVRAGMPRDVWVRGEVQSLRRMQNGHVYFDLVEKAGKGERLLARLSVALFRDNRRAVETALREVGVALENDVGVRVRGRVDYYPPTGRLQFLMTGVDPVFTVGGMAANRERVLRALQADGLLTANRSLTLAAVPLRVGLVTSAGSAAYHDFVHELERSGLAFQVCLADVRVQGAGASKRLTWGLRALTQVPLDVIVVVRGGGSRSDLTAFDAEGVARAIAAMPVPVLTGIGHEIDRTVADEVAYASHKTPTACAQALVDRVCEFVDRLDHVSRRLAERARQACTLAHRDLRSATERARRGTPVALARELAELERRRSRAEEIGVRSTGDAAARLVRAERAVAVAAPRGLRDADRRLETAEARLRALDPRRVLERGYSITRTEDARVAREATQIGVGDTLVTELAAGTVTSRVEGTDE